MLGDGTVTSRNLPVSVSGPHQRRAPLRQQHPHLRAAQRRHRQVLGLQRHGHAGRRHDVTPRLTPVVTSAVTNVHTVAPGYRHTCVLLNDGTASAGSTATQRRARQPDHHRLNTADGQRLRLPLRRRRHLEHLLGRLCAHHLRRAGRDLGHHRRRLRRHPLLRHLPAAHLLGLSTSPAPSPPAAPSSAGATTATGSSATAPPPSRYEPVPVSGLTNVIASPRARTSPAPSSRAAPSSAGATTATPSSATAPPAHHPRRRHRHHQRRLRLRRTPPHLRSPRRRHRQVLGRNGQRTARRQHRHPAQHPRRRRRHLRASPASPPATPHLRRPSPTVRPCAGATTPADSSATATPRPRCPSPRRRHQNLRHRGRHGTDADYGCALLSNGTAKCWGLNSNGQLGDNTVTTRNLPVPVSGLANAVDIGAYSVHTCACSTTAPASAGATTPPARSATAPTSPASPRPPSSASPTSTPSLPATDTPACCSPTTPQVLGRRSNGELGNQTHQQQQPAMVEHLAFPCGGGSSNVLRRLHPHHLRRQGAVERQHRRRLRRHPLLRRTYQPRSPPASVLQLRVTPDATVQVLGQQQPTASSATAPPSTATSPPSSPA
jgi:hypothetical protein